MFGPKVQLGKFETKVGFCLPNAPVVSGPSVDVKKFENRIVLPNTDMYQDTNSFTFDGTNERVNVPNNAIFNFQSVNRMTMSCWGKMNALQGAERAFVRKTNQWQLGKISDTRCRFLLGTSGGTSGWTAGNDFDFTFVVGEWFHALMTWDGSKAEFYMNGALLKTATVSGTIVNNGNDHAIGARNDGGLPFNGNIDEVRLWDRYMTFAEVQSEYHGGCPKAPTHGSNLVSHWPIEASAGDDATGTTGIINDVVGGADGTPNNTEAGDLVTEVPC